MEILHQMAKVGSHFVMMGKKKSQVNAFGKSELNASNHTAS